MGDTQGVIKKSSLSGNVENKPDFSFSEKTKKLIY
jgi:hypothetical protein